jgi:hypothetical protein
MGHGVPLGWRCPYHLIHPAPKSPVEVIFVNDESEAPSSFFCLARGLGIFDWENRRKF